MSLEVEEVYDFYPDASTLLEVWPERNHESCAVGFIHDAVDDSGVQ